MADFARRLDGIPVVRTTAERDDLFPTPADNQRVQNLETGVVEMWDGSAWVTDSIAAVTYYAAAAGEAGVVDYTYPIGHVRRYGATGLGVVSDHLAFTAAFTARAALGGGAVTLSGDDTYLLTAETVCDSGAHIVVDGNGATVKATSRITNALMAFTDCTDITVRNVVFDMGKSSLATYQVADYPTIYNAGIRASTVDGLRVEDCTFQNLYTNAILIQAGCSGVVDILRNTFTSPAQTQTQIIEHIGVVTFNGKMRVDGNAFLNTAPSNCANGVAAFWCSGTQGQMTISNNRMDYCGRDNTGSHRLGTVDFYLDSQDVVVCNNVATNNLGQFMRMANVGRARVYGNTISTASIAEVGTQMISIESTYNVGTQLGSQDIAVFANTLTESTDTTRTGIAVGGYDYAVPATDIRVHDNQINGCATAVRVGGPWDGVRVERNHTRGANGGKITVTQAPGGVTVGTSNGVNEASSRYRGLRIADNVIVTSNTSTVGINVDMTKSPAYTGTVEDIDISGNTVIATAANSAQGIAVLLVSGAGQGDVTIRRNSVAGFTYAFYPRNCLQVVLEGNRASSIGTAAVLDDASNAVVVRRNNRFSSGASTGRAVLVAGTVTISTAEVLTTDSFRIVRVVTGGTVGELYVETATIVNGTSFKIKSSSASDTSTVDWEIIH